MIRLGLRLTLAGGREAMTRLTLIAIAVAIGTALLLTTLAGINAVNAQNARYAWLETGYTGPAAPASVAAAADPLWWSLQADYYDGEEIGRVDLAATGPDSPVPPGIPKLPGPGQYYASPALAKLLRDVPHEQLRDRFPGAQIGVIGAAALPSPTSLIIIIGRSVADVSELGHADQVSNISTTVPSSCADGCAVGVGIDNRGITLILGVVAAALLFPVLIFIAGATRLSAARREQRFAAMRLIGATPRQISVISTVESSLAAIGGVALGFGLFFAMRPLLAKIPFTGDPFYPSDLSLSLPDTLLVVLGVPLAAAVAARVALRRVNISPLGVSRRVTPGAPRAWRLIPLLAGIIELGYLAYFSNIRDSTNSNLQALVYLIGVFSIMIGLVIAGPWLTMLGARLIARRARRPASLIAARRLADNPQASFRAVSGLVLAVFVGTCALGIITTIAAYNGGTGATGSGAAASAGTLIEDFDGHPQASRMTAFPPATLAALSSIPGVTGVATIRSEPIADPGAGPSAGPPPPSFASCAQLDAIPSLGHCPHGATTVLIAPHFGGAVIDKTSMADSTWPAADISSEQLRSLPIITIAIGTDGSTAAIEHSRTLLEAAFPMPFPPLTLGEYKANNDSQMNSYRQLANVVLLTSLPIAGCSLAVSVAGGLAERKRPFSLLRLTGTPLSMLRRVITLEAAVPLLITALVSAGAGLIAAHLFVRAQLAETLQPPSAAYYLLVIAGLLASLAVIASTLPLLKRMTGPETARND
ncbi:FtsX-like permease family protein [Jatrophihabitans sp. DSM 45814]